MATRGPVSPWHHLNAQWGMGKLSVLVYSLKIKPSAERLDSRLSIGIRRRSLLSTADPGLHQQMPQTSFLLKFSLCDLRVFLSIKTADTLATSPITTYTNPQKIDKVSSISYTSRSMETSAVNSNVPRPLIYCTQIGTICADLLGCGKASGMAPISTKPVNSAMRPSSKWRLPHGT